MEAPLPQLGTSPGAGKRNYIAYTQKRAEHQYRSPREPYNPAMAEKRSVEATFTDVESVETPEGVGLALGFRPESSRFEVDRIEDYASLGPELCVPAVDGLGKVTRILRAARLANPEDPHALLGKPEIAVSLLRRAVGTTLRLQLRPRTSISFKAWFDDGVQTIDRVSEVIESPEAYYVKRHGGRFPVRIPREELIRHQTETRHWFEITGIERSA